MILKTILSLLFIAVAGCKGPQGISYSEQRGFINSLQQRTIAQLYSEVPKSDEMIRGCAGYGVFSSLNFNFLFFGCAGSGYGVVTDNLTGRNTYMRMYSGGLGIGSGFKDFREVIIFHDRETMKTFLEEGYIYGGYTDAALKSGHKGGSFEAAKSLKQGVSLYEFTNTGLNLQAVVSGAKYRKDPELNSSRYSFANTGYNLLP